MHVAKWQKRTRPHSKCDTVKEERNKENNRQNKAEKNLGKNNRKKRHKSSSFKADSGLIFGTS